MKKYIFFVLISTIVYSQDIQKNQKLDSLANIFSLEEVTVSALRAKDNTPVPFVNVTKKDLERKAKDSISPSDTIIKSNKNPKKAFLEGKVR